MKKKHIITIVGRPGSGKSTTAKLLAAKLGYKHFSSGDLFRAIGKDRGLDVLNVNLAAEKEKNIDYMVDQKLREIGKKQNNIVIESRMAWHWIPDSFKVYLDLELGVAAQRIINDMDTARREHEDVPEDPVKYAAKLKERLGSESRRYKKLYDVDPYDKQNHGLVIDTATNNPEQVVAKILDAYKQWLNTD